MAKWVADGVLDGALAVIAGANRMLALAGQPESYTAAEAGALARVAMSGGDFAVGAGEVSGRRVTVAAKAGVPVSAAGTADHVALVDVAGARILYVTTCPAQALANGGSVSFDGWSIEIGAPA
jgi:hypothetical protein